jgi:hypothetical protein
MSRVAGERQTGFAFSARLRKDQHRAVADLVGHDLGVPATPPRHGCWSTEGAADQWPARPTEHLIGSRPGSSGAVGRGCGTVDVAMLETLARRPDLAAGTDSVSSPCNACRACVT